MFSLGDGGVNQNVVSVGPRVETSVRLGLVIMRGGKVCAGVVGVGCGKVVVEWGE